MQACHKLAATVQGCNNHAARLLHPRVSYGIAIKSKEAKYSYMPVITHAEATTVYAVIFEGCKFCGVHCKLIECDILILKKNQWLKETMYSTY